MRVLLLFEENTFIIERRVRIASLTPCESCKAPTPEYVSDTKMILLEFFGYLERSVVAFIQKQRKCI